MDSIQPTILIVDDEKHTRDGLRRLLEDDYDTYVAEDIRGAMDVLEREPIDVLITDLRLGGDDGMPLIARALASRKMEQENRTLRQQIDERYVLENIIGESPALREVLDTIKQVAPSSANVLIEGESGTGKELAAQAINNLSRRNKAKLVTVN